MTHIPAPHATLAPITEAQTDAFYAAAALGVAWLDARESSPRRFGPAADASWRTYAGTPSDLSDLDRLELLLRDASSLYPDAFSPRAVIRSGCGSSIATMAQSSCIWPSFPATRT